MSAWRTRDSNWPTLNWECRVIFVLSVELGREETTSWARQHQVNVAATLDWVGHRPLWRLDLFGISGNVLSGNTAIFPFSASDWLELFQKLLTQDGKGTHIHLQILIGEGWWCTLHFLQLQPFCCGKRDADLPNWVHWPGNYCGSHVRIRGKVASSCEELWGSIPHQTQGRVSRLLNKKCDQLAHPGVEILY